MRRFITGCAVLALAAFPAWLPADDASNPADADPAAQSGPAALFVKLDANQDGQVAADEVPAEQKQLFDRLVRKSDTDSNGQLSQEEFVASLAVTRPERPDDTPQAGPGAEIDPQAMFARFDANGDGKVVLDEVPEQGRDRFQNLLGRADKDNDGALSRDEFRAATQPAPGTPPGQPGQELLRRIRQADANGDGMLSQDEAPDQLKRQFARIDANQDGQLDQQELRQALQALAQQVGDAMRIRLKRLDADGDGKISREEAPEPLKRNFDSVDKNQDGFIDQAEARQMNRNRPNQDPNKPKGPDAT